MADVIGLILNITTWIFSLSIIGLLIFIFINKMKYKHQVIIKKVSNGMILTDFDKACEVVKEDGTIWWKIEKRKALIPPPPNECIEINKKGKFVAQFYQIDGGEYVPAKDGFDLKDVDETTKIIKKIQPYTASQRQMMVSQHIKSKRNEKVGIGQLIAQAMPFIAVIMIVVLFMIFFGDAVQPMIDVGDKFIAVADNLAEATDKLDGIINDRVYINGGEVASPISNGNITAAPN